MDSFLDFLVRQKKFALVFSLAFIAIGVLSVVGMQRDQFPTVDFEVLSVTTSYPGASPEDVEKSVTNIIEEELLSVSGIKEITSSSREGISSIIVTLEADLKVVTTVKNDVRNAVNRVKAFPEEVTDLPQVIDFNVTEFPVVTLNVDSTSGNFNQARQITDELQVAISRIKGVASVDNPSYLDSEIQIKVNPDKLNKYKMSINEVISAISSRNARFTVGGNNQESLEKNIVILSEFESIDDIKDVVIKSSFDGPVIRLGDIAEVFRGQEEETSITRVNGTKGFVLQVKKQPQADIIRTVKRVRDRVAELKKNIPDDINIFYTDDSSEAVSNRLDIIIKNGYIGLALVLVVLGVFLSLKTAFWVAVSIPVTLLGTVFGLGLTGNTINLISLSGFILVLGIVVDDSIVIAESIHHYKSKEGNLYKNVVMGLKRVIMPVVTTIISTMLVMSSFFLMSGILGKFIYVLPVVVLFALAISFLEITFALPAHLATNKVEKQKRWFVPVENFYNKCMVRILKWRYLIVPLFIGLLVYSAMFAMKNIPFNLFPSRGATVMFANIEAPNGSSASYTENIVIDIENLIVSEIGDDLKSYTSTIGSYFTNRADIEIALTPTSDRERPAEDMQEKLKELVKNVEGAEEIRISLLRPGPPQGADIEVTLVSESDAQRALAADRLEEILNSIDGVDNINRNDEIGKPRIETVLDFDEMARLGVDYQSVYRHLRTAFSGSYVTDATIAGKEEDVRIYIGEKDYTENFIKNTAVKNRQGNLIPMSQFSTLREIEGEPDYNHLDGDRSIKVTASIADGRPRGRPTKVDEIINTDDNQSLNVKSDEAQLNEAEPARRGPPPSKTTILAKALKELNASVEYPQVSIITAGGAQESIDSLQDFLRAFVVAIVGIFLLLAILFNSYSQPMLVLAAVPFSLIGVIWAFYFHGEPLSFFALTGSLALMGVIVNDSLVMVSHLNYIRDKSAQLEDKKVWIARGSRDRLRAVVLTTLTTMAGVLPLAYGIGGTDVFLQPMVLALGYGLIFGTFLTLILLPCMYLMNYDFINMLGRIRVRFSRKKSPA
ncbi:MAG: efflux RND transporter permease subunit [Thiotrichales bacterium]|jgi:multidrug efflux pump subunit AcrB|nr:efflux RND transporter permease subunit [Thiotrichales bacterium]MBT5983799.1 efflux RND transporter permease subunit [Thiotrichales bacterium]MBT7438503.1 efflux RND transporter permease subunit [Thiotrichales bacterium]MBT7933071.1 efflux RND transporter permease subunit [Thiotrichales bacterium]